MIYNAYSEQKESMEGIRFVSCGHIFAKPGREIFRPDGREDWLLFYIVKGSETFRLERQITGTEGSFLLFAPGEKQHHWYEGSGTAEFYYVHFRLEDPHRRLPFSTSQVYFAPLNRRVCQLFEEILEEALGKKPLYERLCLSRFLQILALLERGILVANHPEKENFERIGLAVQQMNRHYGTETTLEEYAALCGMSKYHFLRVFEKIVGATPMEYRNGIRLQHAAELLLESRLTVEEVGAAVGYSSASYFSSVFRKRYGVSPREYRRKK